MAWYPSAASKRYASPSPSASVPACATSLRPYPRLPGRPYPSGWRALPMWPKPLTLLSEASPMPRRCGSSSVGSSPRRVPTGPVRHLHLSRLHHRTGGGCPGAGDRPPPPRRDRECHPEPEVRRPSEPAPLRPLRRQRLLAGRPEPAPYSIRGAGPQPCILNSACYSSSSVAVRSAADR